MLSEKTIKLAEQLVAIQNELSASIQADTEGACSLCVMPNQQIWVDEDKGPVSELLSLLPKIERADVLSDWHLYYHVGTVPFVSVLEDSDALRELLRPVIDGDSE